VKLLYHWKKYKVKKAKAKKKKAAAAAKNAKTTTNKYGKSTTMNKSHSTMV
jgi:hypothetical protein